MNWITINKVFLGSFIKLVLLVLNTEKSNSTYYYYFYSIICIYLNVKKQLTLSNSLVVRLKYVLLLTGVCIVSMVKIKLINSETWFFRKEKLQAYYVYSNEFGFVRSTRYNGLKKINGHCEPIS